MSTLANKTLFITGASRGIGKAIALRAARDGANVVVAAKTAEPHPKLPGTIYTAAKEIEEAGGRALPCIVDVRSEESVQAAAEQAAKQFGGIDILINNASAISLTGTLDTGMKKYDLMNQINARGTYLCSRVMLPYLLKAQNPHILNISPPLNMSPFWFKGHVAYTMAKYGMSMCVLGMAEEFQGQVAVNALWPRTAIYTAAMEMLGGGEDVKSQCRSVDIMSDAAHIMLTKDVSYSGNFAIDDEVLVEEGLDAKELHKYSCVPDSKLLPDFFLDHGPEVLMKQMTDAGLKPKFGGDGESAPASESAGGDIASTFKAIEAHINPEMLKKVNGVFQFHIDDDKWILDLKDGKVSQGSLEKPDVTMTLSEANFVKMFAGKLNATTAFMTGKLKIKGNMGLALKLEGLMKKMQKAKL